MKVSKRTLLSGAMLALLSGTIGTTAVFAQERTLQITPYAASLQALYSDLKAGFEATQETIRVTLRQVPRDNEEVIQQIQREALVGQISDVAFVDSNRLRLFVEGGLAKPIDDLVKNDTSFSKSGIPSAALDVGRFHDHVYGLPLGVATPMVIFNSKLVQQVGGDPENLPSNWDGIVALARNIDAIGGDVVGAFYEWDNTGNFTYMALLGSYGGHATSPDETAVAFDSQAGLEALKVLQKFGQVGQSRVNMTRSQARQLFASGNLGVLVTSNSTVVGLTEQSAGKFQIIARPFPISSVDGRLPAGGPIALILTNDLERQESAWKFLRYATSPEGQSLLVKHTGYLPINEGALNDPYTLGQYFSDNPNARVAASQLPKLTSWYAFPGKNSIRITDVIKNHLESVVTLRETPEAALKNMAADVTALLP